MRDPLRIISRIRNNRLMVIREQLGLSVKGFSEYVGISYHHYNNIENLSRYPTLNIMERICSKTGYEPEELFPLYLKDISKTTAVNTISEDKIMLSLSEPSLRLLPADNNITDKKQLVPFIQEALGLLQERERDIVSMSFGLNGRKYILEEIAEKHFISRGRVRQIMEKALHKMRNPKISKQLKESCKPFTDLEI